MQQRNTLCYSITCYKAPSIAIQISTILASAFIFTAKANSERCPRNVRFLPDLHNLQQMLRAWHLTYCSEIIGSFANNCIKPDSFPYVMHNMAFML